MRKHEADVQATETDERFPSGAWSGFYHQWGMRSRQRLALTFRAGVVTGGGHDPAGEFKVSGTYCTERGRVSLAKTYPTHIVEYDGNAEGDGIWGRWQIVYMGNSDRGGFHIWPDLTEEGEAAREAVEADIPVGR